MASTASGWQYAVPNDTLVAWPAVSQAVADKLEDVLGATDIEAPWQTWAPTLSGGWANGNGVYSDARYVQIGKTVLARATFTVGSTTTKGTGMVISLPVPQTGVAHPVINTNTIGGSAGRILFYSIESGNGVAYAMDTANPYLIRAGITATVPQTWATNDIIRFSFIYQAA